MAKVPQTHDELKEHFREQVGFIEKSAEAFDNGAENEFKRIATSLRVILHNTRDSKSILKQLKQFGMMDVEFLDSSFPYNEDGASFHGLVSVTNGKYAPLLDVLNFRKLDFEAWWNCYVVRDNNGNKFSRKDLVLYSTNQDGGAHVDPKLDERYAKLSRENTLGWTLIESGKEAKPFTHPERASIRQIAHEALKSFKPGYQKSSLVGGIQIADLRIVPGPTISEKPTFKVGRNDPCPCNSGKKYKKCCGY